MSRSHSNTIQMIFLHLIHLAVLVFVLQSGHSNHERYGFTFTLFVLFFPFFKYFFRTSQSQPRVDATVETFFLPFFHVIFKLMP